MNVLIHTFKAREMFITFKTRNLEITKEEMRKYSGETERRSFAITVWKTSLKLIIDDIIEKGVQFQLTNKGGGRMYICLQRISGENYTKLRQKGAFADFDPVETDFNAYRLECHIEQANSKVYSIPIHLDQKRAARIAELAKQHKIKVGKVVVASDYYDKLLELYPTLPKADLHKIINFGYTSLKLHLSYGADILVMNREFFFLTGKIYTNYTLMLERAAKQARRKVRILYRRLHYLWNGSLYFSISAERWLKIRKDFYAGKPVDFGEVTLFKCYDEAIFGALYRVALFKIEGETIDSKFSENKVLKTDKAELLEIFHDWNFEMLSPNFRTYMTILPYGKSIQGIYNKNRKPYIKWLRAQRWKLLHK